MTGGSALSACVLTALLGCSNTSEPAGGDSTRAAAGAGTAPAACDAQPVKVKDVAGILIAPITELKPVPGDSQSCEYSTGSFPAITISVRPGLGQSTVDAWMAGRMPLKASPMAGIGDAAVWQPSLHEVIAQKHNLLCDVQVRGGASDIALPVDTLPGALGALCNIVFAAGHSFGSV
jgi:hypothetical protein